MHGKNTAPDFFAFIQFQIFPTAVGPRDTAKLMISTQHSSLRFAARVTSLLRARRQSSPFH